MFKKRKIIVSNYGRINEEDWQVVHQRLSLLVRLLFREEVKLSATC